MKIEKKKCAYLDYIFKMLNVLL